MRIFSTIPYGHSAYARVGFNGTDVPEDAAFPTSYKDANGAIWEYVRESAVAFVRVYGKTTAYRKELDAHP